MTVATPVLEQVASRFDFSVDKFPLSGPDGMSTPFYGLFRSDTSAVVGSSSVTSRYVPHTTDDVLALVEATQEAFTDCTATCHFNEGHYVTLSPTKDMRRSIFGTADNIFPRLTIRAGFDGQAFQVVMGYFRDTCLNLSMMRSVRSTVQRIVHNGNLRDRMDQLIAQFSGLREGWEDLSDTIERMQGNDVNLSEFLDSIYPVPDAVEGREVTVHRNRTEEIFNRVMRERVKTGRPRFQVGQDKIVSVWEAYNAVQGHVQHKATRKQGTSDFDRVILASNDSRVRAAEKLAIELAV